MELKNIFFFVFFPELSEIFAKVTMLRKYNQCEYEEQFVLMEIFSVRADCFFIPFFNDIMSIVQEKMYMDVDDVCAILGVSKAYAYNLMREYNKELKAKRKSSGCILADDTGGAFG